MKTFYAVVDETIVTSIIQVFPTLGEAVALRDQDYDNRHIKRYVEYYDLDPATNTWSPITEIRPVIYKPVILYS